MTITEDDIIIEGGETYVAEGLYLLVLPNRKSIPTKKEAKQLKQEILQALEFYKIAKGTTINDFTYPQIQKLKTENQQLKEIKKRLEELKTTLENTLNFSSMNNVTVDPNCVIPIKSILNELESILKGDER